MRVGRHFRFYILYFKIANVLGKEKLNLEAKLYVTEINIAEKRQFNGILGSIRESLMKRKIMNSILFSVFGKLKIQTQAC